MRRPGRRHRRAALPNSVPPIATRFVALAVRALALVEDAPRSPRSCPTRRTGCRRRSTCRPSRSRARGPTAAVSPPGPTTWVWVSSLASSVPVSRVSRAQRVVEAVVGHQQADVVGQRRLGDHDRDLAAARARAPERREVVERDERPSRRRRRAAARAPRRRRAVRPRARPAPRRGGRGTCRRTTGPCRGRSTTRATRIASVLALGRRQRELPHRQPVAPAQLLRHPDRVLGRQQELVPARHPVAHRLDQRLGP